MSIDTSQYYRLTNMFSGAGQALDVKADGTGLLKMETTANYSGQFWRLVDLGSDRYALRTQYLGDCFSLDVINDGTNDTPHMAQTGDFSGQFWMLTPWGDGTYKLWNLFTGPDKSLNVYAGSLIPFIGPGDYSGQHWTLTALGPVGSPIAIPQLVPLGSVYHTEGPSDYSTYVKPLGTAKAVMVFVDFPDAPAGATSAADRADHILGHGQAQQLYVAQSYGKFSFDVDIKAALGWRRMPKPSSAYSRDTFEHHKVYVTDAAALFSAQEVNFAAYQMVFFVASPGGGFDLSPAFNASPGYGAPSPSGEIRLAVTFGQDSSDNRFVRIVHEMGHLMDLPDLYPLGAGADSSKAGCWDIMSDIFHSVNFMGWHRHKNGWLDPARAMYLSQSTTWFGTISPVQGGCGLSMLVLSADRARHPTKVFVVELAQPVLGSNNQYQGEGVLLYTVDASIPSLQSPVEVVPKISGSDPTYGALFGAPYAVGDHASATSGNATLQLTVIQKFDNSYNIRIDYQRIPSLRDILLDFLFDTAASIRRFAPFTFRSPGPWRNPRAPMLTGRDS
jgi:M6 family metalloprotease-like protein